ncbi:MAG TPA: GTPase HflX, partial [Corynebacterium sp.]|nr:GTPase HflX [Corynebacterium sp.]
MTQRDNNDELLARAFRDNAPQSAGQEDSGRDLSGLARAARPGEPTTGELELSERDSFRRVNRHTDIRAEDATDITEVEYRRLRLEQVVLVGVWSTGTTAEVEAS